MKEGGSPNGIAYATRMTSGQQHRNAGDAGNDLGKTGRPESQLGCVISLLAKPPLAVLDSRAHAGFFQPPGGKGVLSQAANGGHDGEYPSHVATDPTIAPSPHVGGELDGGVD